MSAQEDCLAAMKAVSVSKEEFGYFQVCTDKYRDLVLTDLANINVALFAKDSNNAHDQPGLMVTASNIDKHITVVCNFVKWGIATAVGVTSLLALWHAVAIL